MTREQLAMFNNDSHMSLQNLALELLLFLYKESIHYWVPLRWIEDIIIQYWYYENLSGARTAIYTLDIVVNVSAQDVDENYTSVTNNHTEHVTKTCNGVT